MGRWTEFSETKDLIILQGKGPGTTDSQKVQDNCTLSWRPTGQWVLSADRPHKGKSLRRKTWLCFFDKPLGASAKEPKCGSPNVPPLRKEGWGH